MELKENTLALFLNLPSALPYPSVEWGDRANTYDRTKPQKVRPQQVTFQVFTDTPDTLIAQLTAQHYTTLEVLGGIKARVERAEVTGVWQKGSEVTITATIEEAGDTRPSTDTLQENNTPTGTSKLYMLDGTRHGRQSVTKQGVTSANGYLGGTKVVKGRTYHTLIMHLECKVSEVWSIRRWLLDLLLDKGRVALNGGMHEVEYQSCSTSQALVRGDKVIWDFTLSVSTL